MADPIPYSPFTVITVHWKMYWSIPSILSYTSTFNDYEASVVWFPVRKFNAYNTNLKGICCPFKHCMKLLSIKIITNISYEHSKIKFPPNKRIHTCIFLYLSNIMQLVHWGGKRKKLKIFMFLSRFSLKWIGNKLVKDPSWRKWNAIDTSRLSIKSQFFTHPPISNIHSINKPNIHAWILSIFHFDSHLAWPFPTP